MKKKAFYPAAANAAIFFVSVKAAFFIFRRIFNKAIRTGLCVKMI